MLDENPQFLAEFSSDMAYVNIIQELARDFCKLCGLGEEDSIDYSISVRELTINAVKHGNRLDSKKKVKVEFYQTDGEVRTYVQDEGIQRFDPEHHFTANGDNIESDHGRGLIFVSLYTPDWTYEWTNPGNRFGVYKKAQELFLANESQLGQQSA